MTAPRIVLSDDVLIGLADRLDWNTIIFHQSLSMRVVRACHRYFMTQKFYSVVEKHIPKQVDKLKWGLLFNFEYVINIDYNALSREPIPNIFINMFGEALDWRWVMRSSRVDTDCLIKFSKFISNSYSLEI